MIGPGSPRAERRAYRIGMRATGYRPRTSPRNGERHPLAMELDEHGTPAYRGPAGSLVDEVRTVLFR